MPLRFLLASSATARGRAWPGQGADAADSAWFAWRLVGGNNLTVGISVATFTRETEALAAIAAVQAAVVGGALTHSLAINAGRWTWLLSHTAAPVAASARGYQRQTEARDSLDQFLRGAPTAEVMLPGREHPGRRSEAGPAAAARRLPLTAAAAGAGWLADLATEPTAVVLPAPTPLPLPPSLQPPASSVAAALLDGPPDPRPGPADVDGGAPAPSLTDALPEAR